MTRRRVRGFMRPFHVERRDCGRSGPGCPRVPRSREFGRLETFHVEHQGSDRGATLERYAELVRASPHNLLSKAGLSELESRHIPESVRFATRLPARSPVLDIGSGGGLPGLVIAIVRPDLDVHLVEATGKKAEFLTSTAAALELTVTVHKGRAEELAAGPLGGRFPVVTARAVAALPRLIELCAPFLTVDGEIHAIKGERWAEEVTDAESVMRRWRLRVGRRPSDDPELDPRVVVLGRG